MLTYTMEGLDKLRAAFDPKIIDVALQRAMSTAVRKTRTEISRRVRARYNILARSVASELKIHKISGGRLLLYQGRRTPLDRFGMKPKNFSTNRGRRVGATVLVRKDRPRKVVRGKFHQGGFPLNLHGEKLFERHPGTRMKSNPKKEKIVRLFGPAIAQMVGTPEVGLAVERYANEILASEFNRQMELLLRPHT